MQVHGWCACICVTSALRDRGFLPLRVGYWLWVRSGSTQHACLKRSAEREPHLQRALSIMP